MFGARNRLHVRMRVDVRRKNMHRRYTSATVQNNLPLALIESCNILDYSVVNTFAGRLVLDTNFIPAYGDMNSGQYRGLRDDVSNAVSCSVTSSYQFHMAAERYTQNTAHGTHFKL